MMNRMGLGLAVGAGYVLGRTKKMKLAFAVGTLVAGKKMQLSPRAVAELVNQQLKDNPQFKEIGDQLRTDLRGVGKAASGALVERQISALADRLHSRTGQLRDQVSGAVPGTGDLPGKGGGDQEDDEEERDREEGASAEDGDERADRDDDSADDRSADDRDEAPRRRPVKKAPVRKAAKKAPAKRTGEGSGDGGSAGGAGGAAKKTARTAKKAPARKTAAAAKGTARRAGGGQSGEGRR